MTTNTACTTIAGGSNSAPYCGNYSDTDLPAVSGASPQGYGGGGGTGYTRGGAGYVVIRW